MHIQISRKGVHTMESDMECGILRWHPAWLQKLRSIACFTAAYGTSICFTSSLVFYVTSQITALEKQFEFSSSQSGFLLSCNEFGFLIFCLFISFFARKVHIPKALALSSIVSGFCGILASASYFLSPRDRLYFANVEPSTNVTYSEPPTQLCRSELFNDSVSPQSKLEDCTEDSSEGNDVTKASTSAAFAIIAVAMFIGGVAKSPRDSFSTTFIDDNVPKTRTAMYMGILGTVSILGPALGFSLGGVFSKMYVTLEDVNITPLDQRWIGAWWLGFVVFGVLSVMSALPVLLFPRHFHPPKRRKGTDTKEEESGIKTYIKGFSKCLYRLLKNPIFVLLTVATCIEMFLISGWIAFEPKYMETQFGLPAWKANIYVGIMTVIPVALGFLIGGIITTKFKLSPLSCAKFYVAGGIINFLLHLASLMIGCSNPNIVGLQNDSHIRDPVSNIHQSCNVTCFCDDYKFSPVCGEHGVNYFSPCHAGCHGYNEKTYRGCACIQSLTSNGTAVSGLCESDCSMMWPYLTISFIFGLLGPCCVVPITILYLRCVSDDDKAVSIGFTTFISTLVGWFPGPVAFGKVVDSCCILWSNSCEGKGACQLYDIEHFRFRRNIIGTVLYCVVILLAVLVHILSKRKTDWSTENTFAADDSDKETPEAEVLMTIKNQ